MSKLSKLLGKPMDFDIGGETFTIKPLTVKNLDLLMDLDNEAKKSNAMKQIVEITLRASVPDATDEEINGVAMGHFEELTKAILKVNGLDENAKGKDRPAVQKTAFGPTA